MKQRPNFLVFCVDQMQAACLGCAGHPDVRTPNLDQLAARGTRFERAYCENPVCTPSRLSLFTGMSSRQHGVTTLGRFVPETTPTVASALREVGYRTHSSGKLHLQPWGLGDLQVEDRGRNIHYSGREGLKAWNEGRIPSIPEGYFGFEKVDFVGGHADYAYGDYLNWLDREHPRWGASLREHFRDAAWAYSRTGEHQLTPEGIAKCYRMEIPEELHYNRWIAGRTIAFLNQLSERDSFFSWCSFPDPHHPFAATRPYSEMYSPGDLTLPATWNDPAGQGQGMQGVPAKAYGVELDAFNEAGLREMLAQTYGMITHIDDCIGEVLRALEDSGKANETEIIFLADHGDYLGSHHLVTKGLFLFEEIMKVPMIWAAPTAQTEAIGRSEPGLASLLDFAPTILSRAGLDMKVLKPFNHWVGNDLPWFDGIDLSATIDRGTHLDERTLIGTKEENGCTIPGSTHGYRARCYYRENYKLILSNIPGNRALFDLAADPREEHSLWDNPEYRSIRDEILLEYALDSLDSEYCGLPRMNAH